MKKMDTKELTRQAIIAAIYVALSFIFQPISFGVLQFRVAEALMPLAFYDKKNIYGLTIGCAVTNLLSPIGIYDLIFGTLATLLVCIIISNIHMKWLIPVVSGVINAAVVGAMWSLTDSTTTFIYAFIVVFIGEFVVVAIGTALFSSIEKQAWFPWRRKSEIKG